MRISSTTRRGAGYSLVLSLLVASCEERRVSVEEAPPLDLTAKQFNLPKPPPRPTSPLLDFGMRRISRLMEQGYYDEAKKQIENFSKMKEAQSFVEVFERWDRFVDGRILDQHIHGATAGRNTGPVNPGAQLELDFKIMNSASQGFRLLHSGEDVDLYQGSDEYTLVKIRVTEILFDGLGAKRRTVSWLTHRLPADVTCGPGDVAEIPWSFHVGEESSFALKLIRLEAQLYPCAVLLGERHVPISPIDMGAYVVRVYPPAWESMRDDPLRALRLSCRSEDPVLDRHTLIAATLLPRGGEEEKQAFAFLTLLSEEGSSRVRAKAKAALAWLRLDQDKLWREETPFSLPAPQRSELELPGRTLR